jgi:hypothetical protein
MIRGQIYFLTRSYPPTDQTGGSLARKMQVDYLTSLGYKVIVVTINKASHNIDHSGAIISIPNPVSDKITRRLEKVGFLSDYLTFWVRGAYKYLKDIITSKDIIFATSGGELGSYKLASILRKKLDCSIVYSAHDPLLGTKVNNDLIFGGSSRKNRDGLEYRYMKCADAIITSSKSFSILLKDKYPILANKIFNLYFGYNEMYTNTHANLQREKINICYGGAFSPMQSPELLLDIIQHSKLEDIVQVYYVGNYEDYDPLKHRRHEAIFIKYIETSEYGKFLVQNIDYGFVSLTEDWLANCVPSKIFELINLEIPILGALPECDASDIINMNNFGYATDYSNIKDLSDGFSNILKDSNYYLEYKKNLFEQKKNWEMKFTYRTLSKILTDISRVNLTKRSNYSR